jgi:hypothetical protein
MLSSVIEWLNLFDAALSVTCVIDNSGTVKYGNTGRERKSEMHRGVRTSRRWNIRVTPISQASRQPSFFDELRREHESHLR